MTAATRPAPGARILLTCDSVGGVWTYAADLARGLSAAALPVTLAVLGPPPAPDQRAEVAGIPGLALVSTGLPLDWTAPDAAALLSASRALADLAARVGADLAHLHAAALAVDASFSCPVLVTAHSCVRTWWTAVRGRETLPADLAWRADLAGRGYRAADAVAAPTRAFARATAEAYGFAEEPAVVSNGHDGLEGPAGEAAHPPPHAEVAAAGGPRSMRDRRASFEAPLRGAPQDEDVGGLRSFSTLVTAFTAGRLWDEGKNIATLDEAAGRTRVPVQAAGPLEGPNGASIRVAHLDALGRLSSSDVAARLAARPVYCSTALYEPFGLSVLEAASRGCPLVLSDIPTFRELWDGAALFVEPRDAAGLAAALDGLAADPVRRAALGDRARERARSFPLSATLEGTLALYADLMRDAASRAAARPRAVA